MEKQPIFKDINIILTSGGITKEKFERTQCTMPYIDSMEFTKHQQKWDKT
jgi:hypothetical protein